MKNDNLPKVISQTNENPSVSDISAQLKQAQSGANKRPRARNPTQKMEENSKKVS